MIRKLNRITLLLLWLSCCSLSTKVHQAPSSILGSPHGLAEISCNHSISSYYIILWYQQLMEDSDLKLIGYIYYDNPTIEDKFQKHFNVTGDGSKKSQLHVLKLREPEDSATYFCAASGTGTDPAYFGQGTKLTVLEVGKEIAGPTVKVLQPSQKECRNEKDKIRKKTLVCVASKFYPDHVSVYWQIKGENITDGVATDEDAQWMPGEKKRFYQITSRLRVPAEKWETSDNEFKCIVNFYNGSNTVPYSDSISGKALTTAKPMTREIYLKITQTAKLTYGVFIAKSCIYGAFVLFLVWKLQGSKGKQNY